MESCEWVMYLVQFRDGSEPEEMLCGLPADKRLLILDRDLEVTLDRLPEHVQARIRTNDESHFFYCAAHFEQWLELAEQEPRMHLKRPQAPRLDDYWLERVDDVAPVILNELLDLNDPVEHPTGHPRENR